MLAFVPTALYLTAAAIALHGLRLAEPGRRDRFLAAAATLGLLAALAHLGDLVPEVTAAHGLDLHFFAALSAVGAGVALICAALALRRSQLAALGLPVYPIAALCHLAYALRADRAIAVGAPTWQIQLHAGLALLAYATLSVAALVAIGLWLQERALRRRQLAAAAHLFPPLTLVESLLFRLIGAGFALLTLALLSGVVFVENLLAQHLWHKTVLSVLAWAVFGALLLGRWRHGWRGRRAVRLTLIAMALLALAFFGSKFVLEVVLVRGSGAAPG